MRPLLFYAKNDDFVDDSSHHQFLEKLFNLGVEIYPVWEHRNEYDHEHIPEYFPGTDIKMPDTCWCTIPDPANSWPQLYFNAEWTDSWKGKPPRFVAAGSDILSLSLDNIHKTFGTNISGPGDWEL
jgi:hypothetical protein